MAGKRKRTPGGEIAAKQKFMARTGATKMMAARGSAGRSQTSAQRKAANRATRAEARKLQARLEKAGRPKEAKRAARDLRRRAR